jgi:MFS family permease
VDQINLFHEQFITIPIIVTCRDKDYFDLPKKLNLEGAIELQDLNEKQIFDYLNSPGNEMKAVQASLKHDAALRELAKKPLFLSIMVLAYQGKTIEELKPLDSIEARRKHLLNNYISRMFIHKSKLFNNKSKSTHKTLFNNFTLEKTVYWLIWLARQMIKNKGLPFLIEGLQPDLLENPKQKNLYFALYRTIIVVLWAIPTSIAAYFAAKNVGQRLFQINLGVGFSLGIGLFVAIAGWIGIRRRFNIWGGLALGIATGIAFFLPLSDVTSVNNSLLISSLLALFAGVVVVIAGPALTGSNNESPQVEIIESIIPKFPTRPFRTALISIGIGTISAISAKVMFVIFHLQANWINILAIGVCFLFITVSFSGLTWQDKIQTRKYPNQGITRSLYRSILMGISILIISSILIGIGLIQLGSALAYSVAILIGAFFGITGFLKYGGITTIKHYSLRFLLSVYGYLPFSLISFLNYSCQLIFLKKLGNIYKFTHDILRDHFASIPFDETAIHEILFSKYSLG